MYEYKPRFIKMKNEYIKEYKEENKGIPLKNGHSKN